MDFRIFWIIYLLCIGALIAAVAGCGGGGGGGGSGGGQSALSGTWFGAAEDETGQLHAVRMTVAGSKVTTFSVDGGELGGSGPISQDEPQVFSAVLTFPEGQLQEIGRAHV